MTVTVFADLELRWKGKGYVIPESKITQACAMMEDVMTFPEFIAFALRASPPYAKMSMVYATLLRFAGCQVTDNEVFLGMLSLENVQRDAGALVQYLFERIMPKEIATEGAQRGNGLADEGASSAVSLRV